MTGREALITSVALLPDPLWLCLAGTRSLEVGPGSGYEELSS